MTSLCMCNRGTCAYNAASSLHLNHSRHMPSCHSSARARNSMATFGMPPMADAQRACAGSCRDGLLPHAPHTGSQQEQELGNIVEKPALCWGRDAQAAGGQEAHAACSAARPPGGHRARAARCMQLAPACCSRALRCPLRQDTAGRARCRPGRVACEPAWLPSCALTARPGYDWSRPRHAFLPQVAYKKHLSDVGLSNRHTSAATCLVIAWASEEVRGAPFMREPGRIGPMASADAAYNAWDSIEGLSCCPQKAGRSSDPRARFRWLHSLSAHRMYCPTTEYIAVLGIGK